MTSDPYVYPGTNILRNKFGIRDAVALEQAERLLTAEKAAEGIPLGSFDLPHLQAIHHHLFEPLYDWAGEVRTVELNKGGHQFMFRQFIGSGMADIHRRIVAADYLKGLPADIFAEKAGNIIGDINYVHPFREGNGRTQLLYLEQLASTAGHNFDSRYIQRTPWIDASRHAHQADYAPMAAVIRTAIERSHVERAQEGRGDQQSASDHLKGRGRFRDPGRDR